MKIHTCLIYDKCSLSITLTRQYLDSHPVSHFGLDTTIAISIAALTFSQASYNISSFLHLLSRPTVVSI